MRTVKKMMLQPSFNMDALTGRSLSFHASDIGVDSNFESWLLFTDGVADPSEDSNSYSINKNLCYMMLQFMTGTLSFEWFDYNGGPDLRDMSDEECYDNTVKIYRIYTSKLIDFAIDIDPIVYTADVTFDETTNKIIKIKLVGDEFTLDAIERLSSTFENSGEVYDSRYGFDAF